jgi:hypothetical protein
MGTQKHEALTN